MHLKSRGGSAIFQGPGWKGKVTRGLFAKKTRRSGTGAAPQRPKVTDQRARGHAGALLARVRFVLATRPADVWGRERAVENSAKRGPFCLDAESNSRCGRASFWAPTTGPATRCDRSGNA